MRLQHDPDSAEKEDAAAAAADEDSNDNDEEDEDEDEDGSSDDQEGTMEGGMTRRGGRSSKGRVGVMSMAYSGKLLRVGHDAPLTSLAFSADSEVLAATLASGHLALYECARWVYVCVAVWLCACVCMCVWLCLDILQCWRPRWPVKIWCCMSVRGGWLWLWLWLCACVNVRVCVCVCGCALISYNAGGHAGQWAFGAV